MLCCANQVVNLSCNLHKNGFSACQRTDTNTLLGLCVNQSDKEITFLFGLRFKDTLQRLATFLCSV